MKPTIPPPPPPRTPAEITEAKSYLREAFIDVTEKIDAFLETPEEKQMQDAKRSVLKMHGMTDAEIDAQDAEARRSFAEAAREVVSGSAAGEAILDNVVAGWQAMGSLPPYLHKSQRKI